MSSSAVITGGTRGVGLAVARKLCANGADVLLVYGHDDTAAKHAVDLLSGLPGTACTVKADLAVPGSISSVLDVARERWGGLDVLVHSAAAWRPSLTLEATLRDARDGLTVALAPLLAAAPALVELMSGRAGRIVAVSSSGARQVVNRYATQGMAKAALESLVRYLAVDFARSGITVNAVSSSKLDKGAATAGPSEVAAALAARTPAGRLTTPEDIANVVSLLCHADAGWIHGQVITVDGGLSLLG
ncbi:MULTISPECIES: SDR family oxidoreductase [unclassified Streptomyces]|uniref:SDR family oxidoreductase n=1 Tax=unclassified Streptomyces TaxID=2593676 RepID=UPI002E2BBA10|nr:SDR family oxidoreductase [Streptomyces sp. NBC_00273]